MEKESSNPEPPAESSGKAIEKETEAATIPDPAVKQETAPPKAATTENVPDPDEDDLDDLDDMLDEFIPSAPKPTTSSDPGKPPLPKTAPPTEPVPAELSEEDFAAQLQAGMADLLGGLESNPDMAAQFERMLTELGGAGVLSEAAGISPSLEAPSSSKAPATKPSLPVPTAAEESFQETIKKTMERMRTSGDQATAAAASDNTDDLLAEMMKAMQASGLDGEGGGDEEFSKMLLGMMEQLTNKEILYDPMKELNDKFPAWMEKNAGKVDAADMKRYKEQQVYVKEIVGRFEAKSYSDDNAADREYIVERMQKMQAAGSPPADLVGDMAAAQEAFGAPEEGCPTQ